MSWKRIGLICASICTVLFIGVILYLYIPKMYVDNMQREFSGIINVANKYFDDYGHLPASLEDVAEYARELNIDMKPEKYNSMTFKNTNDMVYISYEKRNGKRGELMYSREEDWSF